MAGVSIGWLGISIVSDGVPTLVLPYLLTTAGADDASFLGVVSLVALGLAALIQPIAGRWSDSAGRTPVLFAGVAVCGLGLALAVGWSSVPMIVAGSVLALVGVSFAQAGQQALLPDHVPRTLRGVASGVKNGFDVGGALVGFVILGALLASGTKDLAAVVVFIVLAGTVTAGLTLLGQNARFRSRADDPDPAPSPFDFDRRAHSRLIRIIAARFLFLLGIYVVGRFLFLFVAQSGRMTPDEAAAVAASVLTVLTAVTVICSGPAGWLTDRLGRRPLMLGGSLVGAAGMALFPWAASPGAMIVAGSLLAVGSAAFSAGSWAALVDESAGADSGRLLGFAQLGTAGAAAAAGAFGVVIDAGSDVLPGAGFAIAFTVAAVVAGLGGALAWRTPGRTRRPWDSSPVVAGAGAWR